jgi:hypothetical protein
MQVHEYLTIFSPFLAREASDNFSTYNIQKNNSTLLSFPLMMAFLDFLKQEYTTKQKYLKCFNKCH